MYLYKNRKVYIAKIIKNCMAHNRENINAERLFELLGSISSFVDKKIKMYALGGTALTILGMKNSTLDIDINIGSEREYKYICNIFEKIGFERSGDIRLIAQEGLAFDLFHSSNILGTDLLDDCLRKSKYIKSFGNIEVYTLSLYDVIISKLARGDPRDFDDIKSIVNKINIKILVKRYKETMENSAVSHYRQKLLDLLEIKFKEWSMKIDSKIISGVKKWQER